MTQGYAVLDANGFLIEAEKSEDEAIDVAKHYAEKDGGDVIVDENCCEDGSAPRMNPREDAPEWALARTGLPTVSADEILAYGLGEAWDELWEYLPPGKNYRDSQNTAANSMLSQNAKLAKGIYEKSVSYTSHGLSLAPHQIGFRDFGDVSPEPQKLANLDPSFVQLLDRDGRTPKQPTLCPYSTNQCRSSCLAFTGQNPVAQEPYIAKWNLTRALYANPVAFNRLLLEACRKYFVRIQKQAKKEGKLIKSFVRLNVFQDIPWELFSPDLMTLALETAGVVGGKAVQDEVWENSGFYDYTKIPGRQTTDLYDLTFSYSGTNDRDLEEALSAGNRVAVVFVKQDQKGEFIGGKRLRNTAMTSKTEYMVDEQGAFVYPWDFMGMPVLNGDFSDIRPQDPEGYVVGLTYKVARRRVSVKTPPKQIGEGLLADFKRLRAKALKKGRPDVLLPMVDVKKQDKFVVRVREKDGVLVVANGPGVISGLVPDYVQERL